MSSLMDATDFLLTRDIVERLDGWLMELAAPLLPLKERPIDLGHTSGSVYEFREESERALVVGKAVRMASGIRVAMLLADQGYIAECGSILRMTGDFADEIICICEGAKTGYRTTAHKSFVEQYFTELPRTPDEHDSRPRVNFVTREKLLTAYQRWATQHNLDTEGVRKVIRFLPSMYDKFVHGGYITAMELYDPRTWTFMLRGHVSQEKRELYQRATASKLHHSLTALTAIADLEGNARLVDEIGRAAFALHASGELS
jgi:hypothetical protein